MMICLMFLCCVVSGDWWRWWTFVVVELMSLLGLGVGGVCGWGISGGGSSSSSCKI